MKQSVAFTYDWLDTNGGVERLIRTVRDIYPDAPWYTLWHSENSVIPRTHCYSSFLQGYPDWAKKKRFPLIPFMHYAWEKFDFSAFTHVISISSLFGHSIVTKPETRHNAIVLTPGRYIWGYSDSYMTSGMSRIVSGYRSKLQTLDRITAQRPDAMWAISKLVAQRIETAYHRKAEVLALPFDAAAWNCQRNIGDFYLAVARIEPYKNIELLLEVFKHLPNEKLIVVGTGTQFARCKGLASPNVTFVGQIPDEQLKHLYASAKALLMPQIEEFGYTALESLASGCPVISARESGTAEMIIPNKTGLLLPYKDVPVWQSVLAEFDPMTYNETSYFQATLESHTLDSFKSWTHTIMSSSQL